MNSKELFTKRLRIVHKKAKAMWLKHKRTIKYYCIAIKLAWKRYMSQIKRVAKQLVSTYRDSNVYRLECNTMKVRSKDALRVKRAKVTAIMQSYLR